jgi:hypothetical protein
MSSDFAEEFRAFLEFLQSLWGAFAGASLFFPLSNELLHAVPHSPDVFYMLDYVGNVAELLATLTTLGCFFVVLWTFGQRHGVERGPRRRIYRRAWRALGASLVSLFLYLFLYSLAASGGYDLILGPLSDSSDPLVLLYELAMLLLYVGFFSLLTRSFVLLGLVEYLDVPE